jgi:branched-subunit amino acid ABC-type transport system permease component
MGPAMNEVVQLTVNGLVVGSLIAISAVGLTLVYGILKIVNFAHGDYLTFGAYMALVANVTWSLSPILSAAFAVLATLAFSVAMEFALWRPMRGRGAGTTSLFLTSIGVALVLRHAIQWAWGPESVRYRIDVFQSYDLGLFRVSLNQVTVVGASALLIVATGLFLSRSRIGTAMRAMADDPELAGASGIDRDRIVVYTWIVAGALAGIAGMLLGVLRASITPNLGWFFLLPAFAAVTLGGVGNPYGALAGGLTIGLVMELSSLVVPFVYKEAIAFGVMILVLLLRPQGLLGKARVL